MTIDLEDRLAEAFGQLAAQTPVEPTPPFGTRARASSGRWSGWVVAAAAAVVATGVAGVAVLRPDGELSPATTPSVPATVPTTVAADLPPLFPGPPARIEWERVEPESSIGASAVWSIADGPGGFVAVGQRYENMDDGQGGVWFSADGEDWNEVGPALFASQTIPSVVATSDAYYLHAAPETDEAEPQRPAQMYRSTDGVDWEAIGEPFDEWTILSAAGDRLVRFTRNGTPMVSVDGMIWSPADLRPATAGADATRFWDLMLEAEGRFYLMGWRDDSAGRSVWTSTDGATWEELPAPANSGRLVATPTALAAIVIAESDPCSMPLTTDPDADGIDFSAVDAQWSCPFAARIDLLHTSGDAWTPIGHGPLQSVQIPGIVEFGNQFVAPVLRSNGTVDVVVSVDAQTWSPPVVSAPAPSDIPLEHRGSPNAPYVSGQNDTTIVIPTPSAGVDSQTYLLVGRIASS